MKLNHKMNNNVRPPALKVQSKRYGASTGGLAQEKKCGPKGDFRRFHMIEGGHVGC